MHLLGLEHVEQLRAKLVGEFQVALQPNLGMVVKRTGISRFDFQTHIRVLGVYRG